MLGKVVGVVKEGVDPARHALIEVHILLGSHDIHADIALIAAVEGGHREAQHRQGHHELELLILAHHADHQQHQQKAGQVEGEEAQGEAGGQGARQGDTDKGHIERHIGPQGVQLQPVFGARGTAHHKKSGEGYRPHQAVDVVPHSVGSHEHDHHEQSQEEEGGPAQRPYQAAEQTGVPHPFSRPVDGLEKGARGC